MERQSLKPGRSTAGETSERTHGSRALPPVAPERGVPPAPARLATRFGLTGPRAARRRGGVLRRLLAIADWAALVGALCIATMSSRWIDVGTLFWAVIFSPAWILVAKLQGLYDHDHRRIRHSTLDELPSLVSASVLGTLVLDGLLALSPVGPLSPTSAIAVGLGALVGSFLLRGVLRFLWHRL